MGHGPLRLLAAASLLGHCLSAGAWPAELDASAGPLHSSDGYGGARGYAIEYRQSLAEHFAASFAWLNEGHLDSHSRDGPALQLWWRSRQGAPGLVFAAGLGPYRSYDTGDAHHTYSVDHRSWGAVATAALDWYFDSGLFVDLRVNRMQVANDFGSTQAAAGIGYRFASRDSGSSDERAPGAADRRWELDYLAGRRIFNYHPTRTDPLQTIAARFRISDYLSASVSYLHAGGANDYYDPRGQGLDWVSGAAGELWLEKHLTRALSVGAGLGGLFARTPPTPTNRDSSSAPFLLTTITVAYALTPGWIVRLATDRVAARYNRDCDLFYAGLGYAF